MCSQPRRGGLLTKRSFDNDLPSGGSFCLRFNQSLHDGFDSSTKASVAGHGHVVVEGVSMNLWFVHAEDEMCRVVPNAQGPAFHGIEGVPRQSDQQEACHVPIAKKQRMPSHAYVQDMFDVLASMVPILLGTKDFDAVCTGAYKLEVATKGHPVAQVEGQIARLVGPTWPNLIRSF